MEFIDLKAQYRALQGEIDANIQRILAGAHFIGGEEVAEFEEKRKKYDFAQPFTKESLLYREIFEKYYPGQAPMVKDFWMPNKSWKGCDVNDPSARVLSNYGESGT